MYIRITFSAFAAALLLAPLVAFAQVDIAKRLAPGQPLVVIAHQAVCGGAPENSLAGIRNAIARGVDMVEVDVQITREGQYILMHDWSLRRTTNVTEVFPDGAPSREAGSRQALQYRVSDFTLDDIARLRLKDPQGGDHPVPTLEAALKLAEGRLLMFVELKVWETESLVPVLRRFNTSNLLLWTQMDPWKLRDTANATGIGVGIISSADSIEAGLDRELVFFGPSLKLAGVRFEELTPELVAQAEGLGVGVDVDTRFYPIREPDGAMAPWLRATLDSGATAVWTRLPEDLLELLGR